MNDLVVSIVSYNAAEALQRCLSHVLASEFSGSLEVVVVDNASSDGSAEIARSFPGIRVIEPGKNLFYTGANNRAWESTESSYFLILNSDCYVDTDALAVSVSYLDQHPEVGAVTLRMAFESGQTQGICARFQDRWYSLLWYTVLGGALPRLRAKAKARVFYDGWDRSYTRPVEVAPDSFLVVRRSAFPGELYDEAMALYFTEDDLCMRLAATGWRVDYVAEARVVHPERTSTDREPPRRIRAIFFNDLIVYYRKFEPAWYAALLVGLIRMSELLRRARRTQ